MNNFDFLKIGRTQMEPFRQTIILRGKSFGSLININNIEYADKRLIKSSLSGFTLYACHVTKDVKLDNPEDILRQLVRTPFRNYIVRPYKCKSTGTLQSIVIMSKFRNSKPGRSAYLTIYDKYVESGKDEFKGVLRLELKIVTFKDIRQKFCVANNDVLSVLESQVNPIDALLIKMHEKINSDSESKLTGFSFKFRLYDAYFSVFNYDFSNIEVDMKSSGCSPYKIRAAQQLYTDIMKLKEEIDYKAIFETLLNPNK